MSKHRIEDQRKYQRARDAAVEAFVYLKMSKIRTDASRNLQMARDTAVESCVCLEISKHRIEARRRKQIVAVKASLISIWGRDCTTTSLAIWKFLQDSIDDVSIYDMRYRMDIHPMHLIIDMIARLYHGALGYLQISSDNTLMYNIRHRNKFLTYWYERTAVRRRLWLFANFLYHWHDVFANLCLQTTVL